MLVTVYCCNNHPITRGRHMWLVDTESEARYLEGNTSPDPIGVGYDGLFVCPHCNIVQSKPYLLSKDGGQFRH